MNQREKLIALIQAAVGGCATYWAGLIADHLIANGIIDLSHVMLLEVDENYGSFQIPKVVLYNENHVTREEALYQARAGEYHPSVFTLPKRQWEYLFLNRKEG